MTPQPSPSPAPETIGGNEQVDRIAATLDGSQESSLQDLEAVIEQGLKIFLKVGAALLSIRDRRLYREDFPTFEDYCRERWGWSKTHVNRQIDAAKVVQNLTPIGVKPQNEAQARELTRLTPDQQRTVAAQIDFRTATAADVRAKVDRISHSPEPAEDSKDRIITLEEWKKLSRAERVAVLQIRSSTAKLNKQDSDSIEWARQSTNPVTGCLHNCPYCYARDMADRFYKQGFTPSIIPARLSAPANTTVPEIAKTDVGFKNIFVCSMADLFGKWVPEEWIAAVLEQVRSNPQWSFFLFLTKFPQRMAEFEYPDNAWLGTTVDTQARVKIAEKAMAKVKASVRWVSVEPMLEEIYLDCDCFDWVVIGGASRSNQTPEWRRP